MQYWQICKTKKKWSESKCLNNFVRVQSNEMRERLTAQEMTDHIRKMDQNITFSGTHGQHQNAKTKGAIKTVTGDKGVHIKIYLTLCWPETYDPAEWPMALAYAVDVTNLLH